MAGSGTGGRVRRGVLLALGALTGLLLVAVLIVLVLAWTDWGRERVRRRVVAAAQDGASGTVRIGRLDGNLLREVALADVAIADSAGAPLATVSRLSAEYGLLDVLLRRRVDLENVRLSGATIVLDRAPGERWNFQRIFASRPSDSDAPERPSRWNWVNLRDVVLHDVRVVYREPWTPDSALAPAQRDSVVRRALAGDLRQHVVAARGGYQQVLSYERIGGRLARVRVRHPDSTGIVAAVESLSMLAHPYNPPAIDIRKLAGTIHASDDSLWAHDAVLRLPVSRVAGRLRIGFAGGTAFDLTADTLALAELRWLAPRLPEEGGGRLRLAFDDPKGRPPTIDARDVSFAIGRATVAGNAALTLGDTFAVRGADLRFADVTTALVRRLAPDVKLPREGTLSGEAKVSGRAEALRADVRLAFTEAGSGRTSRVAALGGVAFTPDIRAHDLRITLDPLHVALVAPRSRAFPLGGTLAGSATVSGGMRQGWTVAGDLAHADGAERSRVAGRAALTTQGRRLTRVDADVQALPVSLATFGRFAPDLGLRGEVRGPLHVEGRPGDLRVRGDVVAHAPGSGTARVRGSGRVAGRQSTYDVAAELAALDPSRLTSRAPSARLTGTVAARGSGFTPATMRADVDARLRDSRFRDVTVDALVVRGRAADGLARVDTLVVRGDSLWAEARGTIGLVPQRTGELSYAAGAAVAALRPWLPASDTGTVQGRALPGSRQVRARRVANLAAAATLDSVRIECLALGHPGCPTESEVKAAARGVLVLDTLGPAARQTASLRADSLGGRVSTTGVLRGHLDALDVRGVLDGMRLVALGSAADTLHADYAVARLLRKDRAAEAAVMATGVTARGVPLDSVRVAGTWQEGAGRLDARVVQDDHHDYLLRGAYVLRDGVKQLAFDTIAARLDTVRWFTTRPGRVRLDAGGIAIDSLVAASSYGARLVAQGTVSDDDDESALEARAEAVRLNDLLALAGREQRIEGLADARVVVRGRAAEPTIAAQVNLTSVRQGDRPPLFVVATGGYERGRLAASMDASVGAGSARRVAAVEGFVPADVTLAGTPKVTLHRDRPMRLDARIDSLDLATLPVSHEEVLAPRGTLRATAAVRGTLERPDVSGVASVRGGSFRSERLGISPGEITLDARLRGDTLWVDSLRLASDGWLRASGTVARPLDPANAAADLRVIASGFRATSTGERSVHADADVRVRGAPDDVRITGDFTMREGFLDLDGPSGDLIRLDAPGSPKLFALYDTSGTAAGDSVAVGPRINQGRAPRGTHVDLRVRILRDNFYRASPDASFQFYTERPIRGRLEPRLGGWAEGMEPQDGVIDIGRGITVFRSRAFRMARGSISLVPQPGGRTVLFLEGERETWLPGHGWVRTRILTSGDGRAPRLSLEAATVFPLRAADVGTHLSMGRTPLSLLQQSGSPLTGEATWSGQLGGEAGAMARRQQRSTAFGMVVYEMGHGARQSLGSDIFTVGPPDVATELAPRRIGGFRGTVFEVGQFYGLRTFAAAQVRPTWALPGLRVERWFGQAWRLDAGFEPRFFVRGPWWDPADRHPARSGAFGAFLTREWGF